MDNYLITGTKRAGIAKKEAVYKPCEPAGHKTEFTCYTRRKEVSIRLGKEVKKEGGGRSRHVSLIDSHQVQLKRSSEVSVSLYVKGRNTFFFKSLVDFILGTVRNELIRTM